MPRFSKWRALAIKYRIAQKATKPIRNVSSGVNVKAIDFVVLFLVLLFLEINKNIILKHSVESK